MASEPGRKRKQVEELALNTKRQRIIPSPSIPPSNPSMAFRNGALRITRTPGRRSAKNCVNLGDIIHKENLVSACIYAFYVSRDELYRHLPISRTSNRVPVGVASRVLLENPT